MSSVALGTFQIFDLYDRRPEVKTLAAQHEAYVSRYGWNQIKAGMLEVPVPPRGVWFHDEAYGNVVMFPDAAGVLRFTATDNEQLVEDLKRPVFHSDPEYWELYQDLAARFGEGINLGLDLFGPVVVLVLGAVAYRWLT